MSEDNGKLSGLLELVEKIKNCSGAMDELLVVAGDALSENDHELLKSKTGDFLGYLYFDVFQKYIATPYPELREKLG